MSAGRLRFLGFSAALIAAATGCRDNGLVEPGLEEVVVGDQTISDKVFPSGLHVRSGADITVVGSRVTVRGDLVVEDGASIHGTGEMLAVVVSGNLTLAGRISAVGHLVLVSDSTKVPALAALNAPGDDASRIEVVEATVSPPGVLSNWRITGDAVASYAPAGSPSGAPAAGAAGSGRGRSGRTSYLEATAHVVIGDDQGAPAIRNVENGGDGRDKSECGAVGDTGGTGGSLEYFVEGTLFIRNTDYRGGNGGRGGNVVAGPCPGGSVTGGVGGKPGRIQIRVVRFGQIQAAFRLDGVTFDGWNGGDGGAATITGSDGKPGASVEAVGGKGADIKEPLLFVNGAVGPGGVTFSVLNGGDGGDAAATGGNGTPGVCDLNSGVASASGDGGQGTANAGKGGSILAPPSGTVPPGTITEASFWGGHGGDATAVGGLGDHGVPCPRRGGDGGGGGQAEAQPGAAGQGEIPQKNGARGAGAATGRAGGRGGEGGNGGNGGHGGDAVGLAGYSVTRTGGSGGNGGDAPVDIPPPNGLGGAGGDAGCPVGGPGANGAPGTGGNGRVIGPNGQACP
ncbi:MAG: hypothetical protein ACREMM_11755 [Gemmatimonadales bacterium]